MKEIASNGFTTYSIENTNNATKLLVRYWTNPNRYYTIGIFSNEKEAIEYLNKIWYGSDYNRK